MSLVDRFIDVALSSLVALALGVAGNLLTPWVKATTVALRNGRLTSAKERLWAELDEVRRLRRQRGLVTVRLQGEISRAIFFLAVDQVLLVLCWLLLPYVLGIYGMSPRLRWMAVLFIGGNAVSIAWRLRRRARRAWLLVNDPDTEVVRLKLRLQRLGEDVN